MNCWLLIFNVGLFLIKLGVFCVNGECVSKIGYGQLDLYLFFLWLCLEIEGVVLVMVIDVDFVVFMDKVLEQVLYQLEVGYEQGVLCVVGYCVVYGGLYLVYLVLLDECIEQELEFLVLLVFLYQLQNLCLICVIVCLCLGLL